MNEKKKLVIFDFDGVICDSLQLNLRVRSALGQSGEPEDYLSIFDGNVYEVLSKLHGKDTSTQQCDIFFEKAEEFKYHELPHFDGVAPILQDLVVRGYRLAIVSSTTDDLIEKNCMHHDVHHHFNDILGRTSAESKVHKMESLLKKYSLSPTDSVMVTDTLGDIREAAHVGIPNIGVLWGFHNRERMERAGHVSHFVATPTELHDTLLDHLTGTCGCEITSGQRR